MSKRAGDPRTVGELTPDAHNRRRHGARNLALIAEALRAVGAARSIVIDEKNTILAGNGVREAAAQAGLTKLRIVDAEGDELVAVRRRGLSPGQKRQLALFDNRTAELAEWDLAQLQADLAAGEDLSAFFTDDELAALLGAAHAGLIDPDEVPAERPTDIEAGGLFQLGQHRLLCGDATAAADVAAVLGSDRPALMVTDPPYGVDYDPAWRHRQGINKSARRGRVENDDKVDWTAAWRLFPGDVAYVWHASTYGGPVAEQLGRAGFPVRAQIIWRKTRFAIGRGHYHWQHETCWYAVRAGRTAGWQGDRKQTTTWLVDVQGCPSCGVRHAGVPLLPEAASVAEALSTVWTIPHADRTGVTTHGTQKPVECLARPMRHHRAPVVYEPFCGSGTALIAAEMLGRACRAIEIKPGYVQMAIDRWEAFTGQRAVKLGETHSGETSDDATKSKGQARRGQAAGRARGRRTRAGA